MNLNKRIEFFIKIMAGAIFVAPLIVMPSNFVFPFIVPKILFIRSMVMLMFGFYVILLYSDWQRYKPRLDAPTIAVFAFYLSFVLSTFVGVDWYRSLWDNHERMLGLFTLTHYFLYFLVMSSVMRAEKWGSWQWVVRSILFLASIVMVLGAWQRFVNPEFLLNNNSYRVMSTLGNAIYVGGYGLFMAFMAYIASIFEKGYWKYIAWAEAFLGLLGLFLSVTRGSFLGLVAGIGVALLGYLISLKGEKYEKARQGILVFIAASIILAGILFVFRQTNFVKSIPLVGNVLNIEFGTGSVGTRIMAWQVGIEAWKERPVFGWGPNNFYSAFNEYYLPEFLRFGYGETWFDNAHNILVNTLTVQGVVGVVTYLFIFVIFILSLWKAYKKEVIDAHIFSLGSGFLVAHLVQNVFVFENPTSYLFFFFFLAFLGSMIHKDAPRGSVRNMSTGVAITVAIFVFIFVYATDINPARANMASLKAIRSIHQGLNPVETIEKALSIPSPHIDDIRNDISRSIAEAAPHYMEAKRNDEAAALLKIARESLAKNAELHPKDVRVYMQQAQIAQVEAVLTQDPNFVVAGEKYTEQALAASPKRQQVQYALSVSKMRLNKIQEAIDILRESVQNDPTIGEGWWRLMFIYKDLGDIEKAKSLVVEAESVGAIFKPSEQTLVDEIKALQ